MNETPHSPVESVAAFHREAWRLRNDDPEAALRLADRALEMIGGERNGESQADAAAALAARGYAKMRLADNRGAHDDVRAALERFQDLGDAEGERRCWNTMGIIHGDSSEYPAAIEAFLESKRLCEETGNRRGEADALNNVGIVYVNLGDHSTAVDYYLSSLRLAREIGYEAGAARAHTNLGSAYYELGRDEPALEHLQQSLEHLDRAGERYTYGLTLHNMGRCHARLGEVETARRELTEAHAILDDLDYTLAAGNVLHSLGELEAARGTDERARRDFEGALAAQREANDHRSQAGSLLRIGQLDLAAGRLDDAAERFKRGLGLAERASARPETYRLHEALADLHATMGDTDRALEHHREYARIKDEVFNETSEARLRATRVALEVEQARQEKEIYRLRNVELAEANEELRDLTGSLRDADRQKSKLLARLERQARTDALTGLANRRHFDGALEPAFGDAVANEASLTVVLSDVDNFKRVNDTFGHEVGDRVLQEIARLLRDSTRDDDLVARYGGEEFIALLPGAGPDEAQRICERMRHVVEAFDWSALAQGLRVTLSIGAAGDLPVNHHEKLVSAADDMLYQAKRTGKNRVEMAMGDGLEPARIESRPPAAPTESVPSSERSIPDVPVGDDLGVTIERAGKPLETVSGEVGSISLLKSFEGLELTSGTVQEGGRITLVPENPERPQAGGGREVYYILEGEVIGDVGGERVALRAGDQLYVDTLIDTIILTARAPTKFLYISNQPTWFKVSRELEELQRLAVAVEVTDGYTASHCRRLQTLSLAVGEELGLRGHRLHVLDYASYLHDVGKIRVPTAILNKEGKLTDEEWRVLQRHPVHGKELLESTFMRDAAPIVAQHHERFDGSGYPEGLAGDAVRLEAYIIAVADTFDAMTTDRPYREARPRYEAIEEIERLRDVAFPAAVVDAFLRVLPKVEI